MNEVVQEEGVILLNGQYAKDLEKQWVILMGSFWNLKYKNVFLTENKQEDVL